MHKSPYHKMAEGEVEKDLEKEITCVVCHEHYTDPKVLPCCHYYCKECIGKLWKAGKGKSFSCPECRKDITLPAEGVDSLPTASFVNRMKAVHSKLVQAPAKPVSEKCEMCFEDKPVAFCQQCDKCICEDCVESHQKMKKMFRGHIVDLMIDEKKLCSESAYGVCVLHGKALKYYCYNCGSIICINGTIGNHKKHCFKSLEVAAAKIKKTLSQQVQPVKNLELDYTKALEDVQAAKNDIMVKGDSVAEYIRSSFDELYKVIKNRERAMSQEATAKITKQLKCLSLQEKSLLSGRNAIQRVLNLTEQYLKHSGDDGILHMNAEIQSRLTKVLNEEGQRTKCMKPVEEVDIEVEVSCFEDVKELCKTKAKISERALSCPVTGEGVRKAEKNKPSQFQVVIKPSRSSLKVDCELKTLKTGLAIKGKVTPMKSGQYSIEYIPVVQGRHELYLTVNGQNIVGSPFPVFVSVHPTQLGNPVKPALSGSFYELRCVATNNVTNEIIVSNGSELFTINSGGKKFKKANIKDYSITESITGIAVDTASNDVYASCSSRVVRLSPDLKVINSIFSMKSSFRGLAVHEKEVIVCDYKKTCINVYTKVLEFLREIRFLGCDLVQQMKICDVSVSDQGHLLVVEESKSNIQVFKQDGTFLHSFQSDLQGVQILNTPTCIHVAGQFVFVTNGADRYYLPKVAIFTTDGKFVTAFGENLQPAYGVCVDEDGYVYVAEARSNNIHIY